MAESPRSQAGAQSRRRLRAFMLNLTRVGLNYADYVYNLRLHIDLVRNHLQRIKNQATDAATTAR